MKLFRRTIPDTSLKRIDFEADGKRHFIMLRYTKRNGMKNFDASGKMARVPIGSFGLGILLALSRLGNETKGKTKKRPLGLFLFSFDLR